MSLLVTKISVQKHIAAFMEIWDSHYQNVLYKKKHYPSLSSTDKTMHYTMGRQTGNTSITKALASHIQEDLDNCNCIIILDTTARCRDFLSKNPKFKGLVFSVSQLSRGISVQNVKHVIFEELCYTDRNMTDISIFISKNEDLETINFIGGFIG